MDCANSYGEILYNESISKTLSDAEKWQLKKLRLVPVFERSTLLQDYGRKLFECGSFLSFGEDEAGHSVLSGANFCRTRWCPMCQWRRSLRLYAAMSQLWDTLRDQGGEFLHVVLTVRNCSAEDLPSTLDRMQLSFRHMIRDPALKGWVGALRFTEVTTNATLDPRSMFHPHFHVLVMVRASYFHSRYYVATKMLRELWQQYLSVDYLPQVFMRKADQRAINEIAKYCVKPFDFEQKFIEKEKFIYESLFTALAGRRLYQAFGSFRSSLQALHEDDVQESHSCSRVSSFTYDYRRARYIPAAVRS